jgi:hypothetical protein
VKRLPPGYVRLTCDDPQLSLVTLLGPEPVRVTAGVGGWAVTPRPRQVGMVTWEGVEPLQVELSLLFDGFAAHKSQETPLRRLLKVARGDDESPPGVLEVAGVPLPADEWVIEDMQYGDVIVSAHSMRRTRQAVTLTLREHIDPTYLQLRRRALAGGKAKTRVVTSRKGDTPATVARRQHCKWTELRSLNPTLIHKANQKLKTGTKLRAPVATVKPHRAKTTRHGKGVSRSNR